MRRWLYRSRQFFAALLGRVSSEEMAEARQVLGPRLYRAFARLPGQYRLHGLAVYNRVRENGCTDTIVLQAALLHDAGKYDPESRRYVTIAHRVLVVLLAVMPPGRSLLTTLGRRRKPAGIAGLLLYPFYLNERHAYLGAQIASRHGAHPGVVALIADHHDHSKQSPNLWALRAADEES